MSDRLHDTVAAARAGDRDAVAKLVTRHMAPLEAFVRLRAGKVLTERESVNDLVQSVCREALADLGEFHYRGERELRNWLLLLATRKILDRQKHHGRAQRDVARERVVDPLDAGALLEAYACLATPSRVASAREELARFEAAVDALPDAQREAVVYVKLLGLPYDAVAERLARTEASVRGLVGRALAAIAETLGD
ncbi:MAG: sigma-70 family RNA polymerase sigma factor [Planctomycetota bacterium]